MKDNILLASFINKDKIEDFYKKLEKFYSISKDKTFLFLMDNEDDYMITFKLVLGNEQKNEIKQKLRNTIQIHKKSECFYTINALNKVIETEYNLPQGNVDYKSYSIDWLKYQNKLLLVKEDKLIIKDIKKINLPN
jgi:hypothetical protein